MVRVLFPCLGVEKPLGLTHLANTSGHRTNGAYGAGKLLWFMGVHCVVERFLVFLVRHFDGLGTMGRVSPSILKGSKKKLGFPGFFLWFFWFT